MKKDILAEFEKEFESMKKDLGFSSSLDELDSVFFIRDFIQKEDFLSNRLSRQVCARIRDTYWSWVNYLHSLIAPNPGFMISINESECFNEKERLEIVKLISKMMIFVNNNTMIGLSKDKIAEAKFVDDAFSTWKNEVSPKLIEIFKKTIDKWTADSKISKPRYRDETHLS